MRKFFKRCVVVLLILGGANALLTWGFLRMVAFRPVMQCQTQFDDSGPDFSILAVGDSHLELGFDAPAACPKAFCYATGGENWMQIYYKMRSAFESGVTAERVFLTADPHSFTTNNVNRTREAYYWTRFVNPIDMGRRRGSLSRAIGHYLKGRMAPWAGESAMVDEYFEKRKKVREGYVPAVMNQGFVAHLETFADYGKPEERLREGKRVATVHLRRANYMNDEMLHYFELTLKLCADRAIPVTVIRTPLTRVYYEAAEDIIGRWKHRSGEMGSMDRLYRAVEDALSRAYPEADLRDYHADFFDRDDMFYDADHLNARGAAAFSTKLLNDVRFALTASHAQH